MEKCVTDHSLSLWREEGRLLIQQNFVEFRRLVTQTKDFVRHHQYNAAAIYGEIAAFHATGKHSGLFVSPELEEVLITIGQQAIIATPSRIVPSKMPKHVLHVATAVRGIGGLTRMIWRWITQDRERIHSLVLTRQDAAKIPEALKEAIAQSQGKIYVLNERFNDFNLIAQAQWLREIAATVDLVILHIYNFDVVPLLAFANRNQTPPILFLDHADHLFWLGASISDLIISLRQSGFDLAQQRRGIDPKRTVLLPIIIDPPQRVLSRIEAKRQLGFPEDSVLLLSIARAIKYKTLDGISFADAHVSVLRENPQAFLVVVGAGDHEDWSRAIEQTQGRIIVYPEREDTAIFHQAADIYVDSFPFVSTTSLLEAGSYGVPLVSRFPYSDPARVLGADMPGLTNNLIRTRTLEEYTVELSHLIQDQSYRFSLGEATRQKIIEIHTQEHWQKSLQEIYAYAMTLTPVSPVSHSSDQLGLDEPDVLIPRLHGWNEDFMDSVIQSRLPMIPLAHRLQLWSKLVRKYGLRHRFMLIMPQSIQTFYLKLKSKPK